MSGTECSGRVFTEDQPPLVRVSSDGRKEVLSALQQEVKDEPVDENHEANYHKVQPLATVPDVVQASECVLASDWSIASINSPEGLAVKFVLHKTLEHFNTILRTPKLTQTFSPAAPLIHDRFFSLAQ